MELPLMMWRIFVWFTGRRCCFFIMLFHVQTYGSPSMRTATPGFTSLYEIIAISRYSSDFYAFVHFCLTRKDQLLGCDSWREDYPMALSENEKGRIRMDLAVGIHEL